MNQRKIKVWDLPTRLFHWLLAALVSAALISGHVGGNAIFWHGRIGIAIVGLLTFRLVWGFLGSTYARFSQFIPRPRDIQAYLKGQWQGLGHNPLGALSVLALLALVLLQVGSGLFANDDISFRGPLMDLVSQDLSDTLTELHEEASNLLLLLALVHVGAIIFYARVKGHNLVKPMLTGWQELPEAQTAQQAGASAKGGGLVAFVIALAFALLAAWGASGVWITPPPPPPTNTPTW